MTRRRFFAPPGAFNLKQHTVTLTADEARHLREVLRLKPGDEVSVFDGEGREFRATVVQARRESAELQLKDEIASARPESPLQITLAVALLKGEKFDTVVQKATELGVASIVPVVTARADVRLRAGKEVDARVARALGALLVHRVRAHPHVGSLPQQFTSVLSPSRPCLLFSEREGHELTQIHTHEVTAIIGSEGGWSDEELGEARAAGVQIVTLGGRVLRADTAAISAAALLQHRFGDLK